MISISSSYNINKCRNWQELLLKTKKLGFDTVELNVEIPADWINDIEASVNKKEIVISSLHNYCPKLEDLPKGKSIFFAYNLASPDEEERKTAVALTVKTVETAQRLGAKAVVIHSGEVNITPSGRDLFVYAVKFGRNARLFEQFRESVINGRREYSKPYFDNLKKSLSAILELTHDKNVKLGLETRIYYNEMPNIEEFHGIFEEFSNAPLYYWHDTGHAEVNVRLGLVKEHTDFLKPFKARLLGMHLHDLNKFEDHLAPGSGDFDFKTLIPFINRDTIKVVEAHSRSSEKEVKNSLEYFRKIGLIN